MTRLIVRGATVVQDNGLQDASVLVADDRIVAVDSAAKLADAAGFDVPATVVDAEGCLLAPGFIELQTNGGFGLDLTANPGGIWQLGRCLAPTGVTAFLPTVVTAPAPTYAAAQHALAGGAPDGHRGAVPLGFHFEGPFLNPQKRGAHDPAHLRLPDPGLAAAWSSDAGVRLVTLAPELQGAIDLARALLDRGVVVSAGHSMATAGEARVGFDAGIRYGTHLFNAMPTLEHRAPGLAGALLADERMTVGLIADGLHVDPTLVDLAWRIAGPDRFSIVTDQMTAVGLGHGEYSIGSQTVFVGQTGARLADGRLAGSLLTLDEALRNLVRFTGCSLPEAIATVTRVPARLLGIEEQAATIAPGRLADLVLLTPELRVVMTIVGGTIVYDATRDAPAGTVLGPGAHVHVHAEGAGVAGGAEGY